MSGTKHLQVGAQGHQLEYLGERQPADGDPPQCQAQGVCVAQLGAVYDQWLQHRTIGRFAHTRAASVPTAPRARPAGTGGMMR